MAKARGTPPKKKVAKKANGRPVRPRADQAIGVFDSGVGGLTVLHELSRQMPRENLIYLGDTARVPYGPKSGETITRYAIETADFFVDRGVKLMVVACNTTTALALDLLRQRYPIPVIGVIEPGARAALKATRNQRVGVIGTEATVASGAYAQHLRAVAPEVEIFTRACPMFVPLAEEGWTANDVARRTVATYLASLKKSGIDTMILGCTHYPLLAKAIGDYMGPRVRLVDSAEETAREVKKVLSAEKLARKTGKGSASFFVTDLAERFTRIGERFYGSSVSSAVRVVLRDG
ncbi:MAG: glutamate racemase [Candidatus Binatia bacterium]|nr:glutamate racemase [Candidatus Binatia bacterium]